MSVSMTELIWQAKTENPESIWSFFFFRCLPILILVNGKIKGIHHRLQFVGLPVDVNSLWKEVQACFRLVFGKMS